MYVISGATGKTGSVVAERLLTKGEKVRVVGRDPKRLERFKQKVRNHSSLIRPMRARSRTRLLARRLFTR
jgi:uncharacterized protein YbjT (DUF2867 family)